jgi:hypothetical protein
MKQTIFGSDGTLVEPKRAITPENAHHYVESLKEIKGYETERAVCPFCLYESTLDKFAQFTSDNKVAKTFKCKVCGQEMRYATLQIYDQGAEQYADWFWTQMYYFHGRDRFRFDTVKNIMRKTGCGDIFWDAQKRVKLKKQNGE